LSPKRMIGVVRGYFKEASVTDVFLANFALKTLSNSLELENDVNSSVCTKMPKNVPIEIVDDLIDLFDELQNKRTLLSRRGQDDLIMYLLNKHFDKQEWLLALMPEKMASESRESRRQVNHKKIEEKIDTGKFRGRLQNDDLNDYGFLSKVFDRMDTESQQDVVNFITSGLKDGDDDVLKTIFEAEDSNNLDSKLIVRSDGKDIRSRVHALLTKPEMLMIISTMADYPEEFGMELGEVLAMVPFREFPRELRDKLHVYLKRTEQKIRPFKENWYLCSDSEALLVESMQIGAVVIVNESLVVKFKGKFTALCIESFVDKSGNACLAGNWYSPANERTRSVLREANRNGDLKINLTKGEWALMRKSAEVYGVPPRFLLKEARVVAKKFNKKGGRILGKSREEFADDKFENHTR